MFNNNNYTQEETNEEVTAETNPNTQYTNEKWLEFVIVSPAPCRLQGAKENGGVCFGMSDGNAYFKIDGTLQKKKKKESDDDGLLWWSWCSSLSKMIKNQGESSSTSPLAARKVIKNGV